MENKLSVIIITYNMGHMTGRALESLRAQTAKDFDVVIIDNHSTDNTREIIKQFDDLKVAFWEIKNNGILSKSRNLGVSKAKGNWISFLDADDYWEKNKVKKITKIIDIIDNSFVAISHRCYVENHVTGNKKMIKWNIPGKNLHKQLILGKNPFCLTGTVVRKTALMSAGGFSEKPEYKTVEDYELWIRLSACGNFYCIDDPLATIVLHEGNYSRKANIQMHALDIMKRYYLDSDIGINTNERRKAYIALYELETRCLQKNGFFSEAILIGQKAMREHIFSLKIFVILCLAKFKIPN